MLSHSFCTLTLPPFCFNSINLIIIIRTKMLNSHNNPWDFDIPYGGIQHQKLSNKLVGRFAVAHTIFEVSSTKPKQDCLFTFWLFYLASMTVIDMNNIGLFNRRKLPQCWTMVNYQQVSKRIYCAVVVVKWSACSPSTMTIRVRVLL